MFYNAVLQLLPRDHLKRFKSKQDICGQESHRQMASLGVDKLSNSVNRLFGKFVESTKIVVGGLSLEKIIYVPSYSASTTWQGSFETLSFSQGNKLTKAAVDCYEKPQYKAVKKAIYTTSTNNPLDSKFSFECNLYIYVRMNLNL